MDKEFLREYSEKVKKENRVHYAVMKYGIGRIPADVDPTSEAIAELEAQQIQPKPKPKYHCSNCGKATNELMSSAHGSVCPECYDECSD